MSCTKTAGEPEVAHGPRSEYSWLRVWPRSLKLQFYKVLVCTIWTYSKCSTYKRSWKTSSFWSCSETYGVRLNSDYKFCKQTTESKHVEILCSLKCVQQFISTLYPCICWLIMQYPPQKFCTHHRIPGISRPFSVTLCTKVSCLLPLCIILLGILRFIHIAISVSQKSTCL